MRLSPFDAAHRRHTAFALVEVLPEIEDDHEITIGDDDLRIDTYRASGAGGQHVNKTSSAGASRTSQRASSSRANERSQIQNRESAKIRAPLERKMNRRRTSDPASGRAHCGRIGNRIRSYVLHPYTATDHRTEISIGDTQAVLDGAIDPFIEAYLHQQLSEARTSPCMTSLMRILPCSCSWLARRRAGNGPRRR